MRRGETRLQTRAGSRRHILAAAILAALTGGAAAQTLPDSSSVKVKVQRLDGAARAKPGPAPEMPTTGPYSTLPAIGTMAALADERFQPGPAEPRGGGNLVPAPDGTGVMTGRSIYEDGANTCAANDAGAPLRAWDKLLFDPVPTACGAAK